MRKLTLGWCSDSHTNHEAQAGHLLPPTPKQRANYKPIAHPPARRTVSRYVADHENDCDPRLVG